MKQLFILLLFFAIMQNSSAQPGYGQITLLTPNKQKTNLSQLSAGSNLVVLSFWATWCKPCILEQNAIADNIDDWQEELSFKYIAVSIDDSRSDIKVKSFVNGSAWNFDVVLDQKQELKRYFGVNNVPFTVILKNNKIVYRHAGYLPGDENILWQKIKSSNE